MESRTLVDVVRAHLQGAFPDARRGYYDATSRQVQWVPVAEVGRQAFGFARRLRDALPDPRSVCMLHDLQPQALSVAILAAMAAGSAPLVLPRNSLQQGPQSFVDWVRATFGVPPLLVSESLHDEVAPYPVIDGSLASVTQEPGDETPYHVGTTAFLQCTSATTGISKVAKISHENLLQNVHASRKAAGMGTREVMCSWLPLYHDMGLVGCELLSLVHGYRHVSLRAYDFLRRPSTWLRIISECRGTMSPAPNFAYQYAADHARDDELEGVDLTSWRIAFNGAEPVRVSTMRAFAERFARCGFRQQAFCPSYGLAEATLAVCLSFSPVRYLIVDRETVKPGAVVSIRKSGEVFAAGPPPACEKNELLVTSCGPPIACASLALAADGRETAADDVVGEIVVRGSSVFEGYVSPEESSPPSELRTGDLGFLHGGELYIVDRLKNIVIINGDNYPASDLEERVGRALGVPPEGVMVFDGSIAGEKPSVVAVIEAAGAQESVAPEGLQALSGLLTDVVFVKRRSLPKTTSGKKQHYRCRSLLASGQLPVLRTISLRS